MAEKYLLLPLNPQQLTPVQTAIQSMSEKHPDFEIEPVNTVPSPEIEYAQMPQVQDAFSSVMYRGRCLHTFSWFSRSEACAFVWGIFVRGLRIETFVRVLRSSRVIF